MTKNGEQALLTLKNLWQTFIKACKHSVKLIFFTLSLLAVPAFGTAQAEIETREIGALRLEGVPDIPPELIRDLARYQDATPARLLDWSFDNQMLISARLNETPQLFLISSPDAPPRQITLRDQRISRGQFARSDDMDGIVFNTDRDGDESYQYYFKPLSRGPARALTQGPGRNSNAILSPDRKFIAYTKAQDETETRGKNNGSWGMMVTAIADGTTDIVFQDPGAWAVLDWSPNGRLLLVLRFSSVHDSNLYIVDIESGVKMPIDVQGFATGYTGAQFSADGKGIYIVSNASGEFMTLRYLSFGGQSHELSINIPWNINEFSVSGDGQWMAYTVNEGGIFRLNIRNNNTGNIAFSPHLPKGQISDLTFSPNGRYLGFTLDAARSGQAVYALDIESGNIARWSNFGQSSAAPTFEPEIISYPTFDRVAGQPRQIPALIYKPDGPGPHPVIIRLHGGPESQWVAGYSEATQYWVGALGVAVIKPNIRGSTGYGRSFTALDDGFAREDAVKDVGALLDWIATQKDLDASRVMVQGGSYGGYLALASLVHYGDRLKAGMESVGITNFVTFLESTGDFRRDLRRVEYGDETDPETRAFLNAISPLTNVARIHKPLFISQGANDPRVPENESAQMVAAIHAQGGDVWYIRAGDEGHGFIRRSNADIVNAAGILFIRRYLLASDQGTH